MTTFYYNDDALDKAQKRVFRRACEVWSTGVNRAVTFQYIDRVFDPSDMSIIVRPATYLRADECGRAVPAANANENNFLLLNSSLKFGTVIDTDLFGNFRRQFAGDYDLLSVCEHELGHIFGLKHNESVSSIMQDNYFELPSAPSKIDYANMLKALVV